MSDAHWAGRSTLVTGGASFIGSHLVDALVARGASVRVVDNLSSGERDNLAGHLHSGAVELREGDLLDQATARAAVDGIDTVFHLAADHGGRGYIERHQAACATNLALDTNLFIACHDAAVDKVVFASSGCVYPTFMQADPKDVVYLTEDKVGPPFDADNLYGWAKLMGEMTLKAFVDDYGIKGASCRYFTVYGERGKEDHAVMAMIARAFLKKNPFEVWGDGQQIRNWTYVSDIVEGTILAAEKIDDGTAVNLGTTERTRVIEAARAVLEYTGHDAEIELHPEMPTGPLNRVAGNSLAKELLGWEPRVSFLEGLHRTIDWYFLVKEVDKVAETFEHALTER